MPVRPSDLARFAAVYRSFCNEIITICQQNKTKNKNKNKKIKELLDGIAQL